LPVRPTLKFIAGLLAVLLMGGTTVVLAAGSPKAAPAKRKAAVTKAAAPKVMHVACARASGGKLQYRPDGTEDCAGKIIHFPKDAPVTACQLDKGNSNVYEAQAKLAPPAHKHAVTGMLFVVSGPGKCKAPKYPDSHPRVLPPTKKNLRLCAGKRRGTVRVVNKFSQCNDLEFDVVLKKLAAPPVNHKPTANDQTVNANEDTAEPITLTGSDPDGDSLTFSIASGPSDGTLTGTGAHRVYHPSSNFTGTDSFTFKVADGHGGTDTGKVTIHVGAVNDAPTVATSAGSTAYSENDPPTPVDPALTVSDVDDTSLEGATVSITAGFDAANDELSFTDQNGITGTYDSGTGVLTLTGTASVADYQAALRSVGYQSSDDDPPASKGVTFKAGDGDDDSNGASKAIAITPVNDAPTVTTSSGALAYTEGDGQKAVDAQVAVADVDSGSLSGAVVRIASGFVQSEDSLSFTNTASITGSYDSSTGTLTLTGTATVSDYQAALRSIKYSNSSANPSTTTRTVSFKVTDSGGADSNTATRNVDVTAGNTKPTVTTSAGSASNTEGSSSTIDGALTVADPDDTDLEGATVSVRAADFQSGDDLIFVNTPNISGVYNTGTGVLTLTGHDTLAAYQSALRSIQFRTTNDDPSSSRRIDFTVNDGDVDSDVATKSVTVTPVNDAPTLLTSIGSASYVEGGTPQTVDPDVTAQDADSDNLSGATVSITGNFSSADGDTLNFTNTANITGSYNSSTGVLTLAGTDTVAAYNAALQSITYSNTSDNPSTATRTVSFQVTDDGALPSNTDSRDVTVAAANDAPVVTTTAGSTAYTEGDPATTIDSGLTVTDADDTNIEGGQVRISSGFQSGDDLVFVNTPNISGVYNTGTGVLTLSGTDTVANYQAALRSIQYRHTGDNPGSSKTVEFKVSDGDLDSNAATKGIAVTPVNDAPTLTTTAANLTYTEGDGPKAIDPGLTVDDPDSTQIQGATVQITGNFSSADDELAFTNTANITGVYNDSTGTLTLSGTDTLANYQAALRSVTFENVNTNPSGSKTVSFQATDAQGAASNVATRTIDLQNANTAPTVTTSGGSTAYTEGDPATTIDGSLTVTDPDSTNITGAEVTISTGFESGDDLVFVNTPNISGVYNTGTGVLTLSGTDTVANYQAALRSIQYRHTGDNPGSSKTVSFKVTDDGSADSNTAFKGINITGVNDAPTLNTTATNLAYTEGDGAQSVDTGVTLTDPDSTQIQGATVQITGNFSSADDELSFVNTANITGVYNDSTGTLTLSGTDTLANYQSALRSVKYENVSDNPSGSKTVSFQATDSGGAASNVPTRQIDLTGVNDAPVVTTTAGSTAYTEGDPATTIDSGLTVTDADDTNIEGGQVRISSGFQSGDDLVFVNQNGISGVYNTGTGVLTLTGTASVADYQTALRSIQYQTTSSNPSSPKTVEFKVSDGALDSNAATKNIAITGVNTAPTVTTTATALAYTEGDGPTAGDSGVTVSDPDSTNLSGAKVSISANFVSADDELAFTNTANITGSYNDSTGVLTLSGTDTVANYQAALRSVTYENVSQSPSGSKTLSYQVTDDGALPSNTATRTVNLTAVNDAPVVTPTNGSTAYTEGDPATTIDSGITVTDADDTNIEGGQVRISSGFQSGDDLVFVNQNGISGVYNTGTGVLTLTGTSSVANYQTALRSIQFQSTQVDPVTSKTVEFKVNDGDVDSNTPTKEIAVTPVNSPPTVDATNTALGYTENDAATAVDGGLTVTEPEGDDLSGASASITSNYQAGQDFLSWTDNNLADNITLDNINTTAQTVVLTGLDSDANYQAALRAVKYQNGSESPSNLTRTVTFSATDSPGGATGSDTRGITVTPVDDPPDAVNDSAALTEDDPATSIPVLTNDTDIDGGPKTISSATDPANGTVVLTGGSPGAHTGLTYQPDANYCNNPDLTPPSATPDTFQYTLNGGDTAFVSVTVKCVNDAPVATDETFNSTNSAIGNTTLNVNDPSDGRPATPDPTDTSPSTDRPHKEITGDILSNDTDVDSPSSGFTVTPGTFATNDGGSVTIQSDGDFNFEPAASTSCTDTSDFFDYTLNDNDSSGNQTDTGRVTIAITGCVWYVNNNDAQGNSGTSEKPFDSLSQAETASGTNHSIFVYDGNNTTLGYTTGLNMKSGQKLIGEAADLAVGSDTLHSGDSSKRPQLTDTTEDVVALDDGNTVAGIEVDPTGANSGIAGAAGDTGGGTISDVRIIDTGVAGTAPNLELDSTTGTFNVSNLTVDNTAAVGQNSGSEGVRLNNAGTVNFAPTGTISINTSGAKGLEAVSTGLGTSTFDAITVAGSATGGVRLDTTTGTVSLGDGTGTDLSLTTTSGSEAALRVNSHTSGSVTVPSGGTANLSATGGPAADVTSASGSSFDLDTVSSTNSANDGINLDGLGSGAFTATAGTLTGASGITFDLNGGSGKIDYPGSLGNGSGTTAVDITGRSGGTGVNGVTLSGSISDTNDTGGTINVSSNTGGDVTLSGSSKQANTGTSDGVIYSTNSGGSLTLSGGNLDIDTTTAKGLEADNTSGTLTVTGTGNTINTTTGRGLNMNSTTVGSSNATFDSISSGTGASGPANGIKLNNTGTTGTLFVTGGAGSTADGTGGTIQMTSGNGVDLRGTHKASLEQMNLTNTGDSGSYDDGGDLDMNLMNITGAGDAVASVGNPEAGTTWVNNIGSSSVSNSTVTGAFGNGLDWQPTAGPGTLDVSSSKYNNEGNAGVQVIPPSSANNTTNVDFTYTGGEIKGTAAEGLAATGAGAATVHADVEGVDMANTAGNPTNFGVEFNSNTTGHLLAKLNNSTIKYAGSSAASAVTMTQIGTAQADITITNNTIGTPGTNPADVDSGTVGNHGISLLGDADTTTRIDIENNTISHTDLRGIHLLLQDFQSGAGISHMDATVKNNTVNTPDADDSGVTHLNGILLEDHQTNVFCADVTGNHSSHIGTGTGDTDIRVRGFETAPFNFEGYSGGDNDTNLENFLLAANPTNSSGGATTVDANDFSGTSVWGGPGACTMPTLP
jgi:hypothetical protein